jgi:hypothetical protein
LLETAVAEPALRFLIVSALRFSIAVRHVSSALISARSSSGCSLNSQLFRNALTTTMGEQRQEVIKYDAAVAAAQPHLGEKRTSRF